MPNTGKENGFGDLRSTSKHKLNEIPVHLFYKQDGYGELYGIP